VVKEGGNGKGRDRKIFIYGVFSTRQHAEQ